MYCSTPSKEWSTEIDEKNDNKEIYDQNDSQQLTQEEIEAMKGHKDGKEIVGALVTNSKTFESKTEYAQQKYTCVLCF